MRGRGWVLAVLLCTALPAQAQEQFNAGSRGGNGEVFNGGNSNRTGTQGVVGNPFCPPPHEIINGKDVTPKNWSCATVQQPYVIPKSFTLARPGPVVPPGAANPCQPGGPGGYNFLNNPVGTRLPAGCARAAAKPPAKPILRTFAKSDTNYESAPPGYYLQPPVGPPGSYIQPEAQPGDYLGPTEGAPGGYIDSTARSGPQPRTVTEDGPNGTVEVAPGPARNGSASVPYRQDPYRQDPYRQDTGAMQGGVDTGQPAYRQDPYRQDIGAMRGGFSGNNFGVVQPARPAGKSTAKIAPKKTVNKPANSTLTPAQTEQLMNAFLHMAGSSP